VKAKILMVLIATFALGGCETLVAPRYSATADNNLAVKALGVSSLGVGEFTGPSTFDSNCRAIGPVQVADGITHTQYIRKAFEEEFKLAGVFAGNSPRITLTGTVTRLEFSSTRAVTGGSWDIDVALMSSNGSTMKVTERYEFPSGFLAPMACKQTAEAFAPAVQNLVGKAVRSTEFRTLVR
jgi:hypothetical protein